MSEIENQKWEIHQLLFLVVLFSFFLVIKEVRVVINSEAIVNSCHCTGPGTEVRFGSTVSINEQAVLSGLVLAMPLTWDREFDHSWISIRTIDKMGHIMRLAWNTQLLNMPNLKLVTEDWSVIGRCCNQSLITMHPLTSSFWNLKGKDT